MTYITTILLISILVLLIIFAVVFAVQLKSNRKKLTEVELLLQQLQNGNGWSFQKIDEDISDMQDKINALSGERQDMLSMMSQISQNQTTLLESIQRQLTITLRNQEERLTSISRDISDKMTVISNQIERLKEVMTAAQNQLRQENNQQLNEMRRTVDERLTASLDKKLSESFALVSTRLEQVYKGLGEMQSLASGVGDLKKVLTNVKTRGIWGEIQLGSLMSEILTNSQYDTNVAVIPGATERVEFAIRIPDRSENCEGNGVIYLPIDSKFPQEDYIRLTEAEANGDNAGLEEAKKALITRIRVEGKRISTKYIKPSYTTDFAIMFLPVEGLYCEVVQLPGLIEELQNNCRVVVAGPSTFSALLNSLQMGFRSLAIEKRSSEVWQLLSMVKNDFGKFADTLEKTKLRLQQATDSIDNAYSKTKSIERRLGNVEKYSPEAVMENNAYANADIPDGTDDK